MTLDFIRETMRHQKTVEDIKRIFREETTAELEERHFTKPEPIRCKFCGSLDIMKYGLRNGIQEYICQKCRRKFNDKDAPYRMRTTVEQLGASLNMFYDGLSLADISRHLAETYHNPVSRSSVYRWIVKYASIAIDRLGSLTPKVGSLWVVDETVLRVPVTSYGFGTS